MPTPPGTPEPPAVTRSEHAGLTVRTVGPPAGGPVNAVAVICHGFGAPGGDLVGVAEGLLAAEPTLAGRVRLHFPAAPLDLGPYGLPGGRAWWMLDQARLNLPPAARVGALRNERPGDADALRERFDSLIDSLLTADGLPPGRLLLGGFSQGSMLATDFALRSERDLGGLVVWSGAMVAADEWEPWAGRCPARRVFQSHGTADQILPFAAGEALRDTLVAAGHAVRFARFAGGHAIPPAAVAGAAALLREIADDPTDGGPAA